MGTPTAAPRPDTPMRAAAAAPVPPPAAGEAAVGAPGSVRGSSRGCGRSGSSRAFSTMAGAEGSWRGKRGVAWRGVAWRVFWGWVVGVCGVQCGVGYVGSGHVGCGVCEGVDGRTDCRGGQSE